MKTTYSLLLIYIYIWIFCSCKAVDTYSVMDLNGKWTIIEVNGEPVISAITPFFEFDVAAKRVHGNTGCNTFSAAFETEAKDKAAIRIVSPVSTMMACINMETETQILQVFPDIVHVRKGEISGRIKFVNKNEDTMLLLEKK